MNNPTPVLCYVALVQAAEAVQRSANELLKTHGLHAMQYNVLRVLRGAGPEGLPCGAIAERLIHADPDITRCLDRLARQNLIARWRDDRDRRVVRAAISDQGRAAIAPLDAPLRRLHQRQFGGLSASERLTLCDLLARCR